MRLLADPTAVAEDFTRPGHVVPLRAKDGGVLRRPGHTEAAVDLARLAGLQPAGAICEIVSQKDEGEMAQTDELRVFADEHDLALISIADLIDWRRKHEKHIERIAEARIPTAHGEFRAVGYTSMLDDVEHVALVLRRHSATATDVAGARALRVPDRRRVRLAALRLRPAARRRDGHDRRARAAASCSTCAATRAAASACCTSCRPTSFRTPARTPSTPTSSSACPPMPATTASARRSSSTSASGRCGC